MTTLHRADLLYRKRGSAKTECNSQTNKSKQKKSRKTERIKATLTALIILMPSWANAEDYFWWVNFYNDPNYRHSTPIQACQQWIEEVNKDPVRIRIGTWYEAISISPEKTSDRKRCNMKMHYSKGISDKGLFIARGGNSCPTETTYNEISGECTLDPQKGPPNACNSAGNPINFAIGNKFQSETDYSLGGSSTLNFTRSYNSLDGIWHHSFSTSLSFAGTQYVSVMMHHGRESFFTVSGSTVTPTSADLGVLSKLGTTGWQYISTDNERFAFDTAGKLTQWSNAHGAVHQFAYAGNQVTVTDNLGNSLSFTEDANKQPLTLTTPGVQITYGYNADKRLTSVIKVMGGQTTRRLFHYEDPRNNSWLTGITDERGVRYATWSYDDKGRAISSEHADGTDKVTVTYNADGTVSVTNELGKVTKYSFQYIKGVKRITAIDGEASPNCPNSNSTFTYDDRGLLKTKTDNKGNLTTYTYNARGLEISRTEASGTPQARTITTDWHADFFLPVKITEPDRITQYSYDAQGRQTSQAVTPR